jgi:excisionase family DNA binding protein
MMKRRTEITVERKSMVFRRGRHAPLYCTKCSTPTLLLAPDEAAVVAGVSTRTIYRWVETERLHFTETPGGRLFVCPNHITYRSMP